MLRSALIVFILVLTAACGSLPLPRAAAPPGWVFYTMDAQQGADYGVYLWKPRGTPQPAEACRAEVRRVADRGDLAPVGLIAWYPVPGPSGHWVGCLPEGYDPYERR